MHKHFRMIAISEHLRNHGFDPEAHPHTRIPYIWEKLRTFYNLETVDDRENNMDFGEDEKYEDRYLEFRLRGPDFEQMMLQRAVASDAATSPSQLWLSSPPPPSPRKRKRGESASKTRASTVDDTEEGTDAASPVQKSARGGRGRKRAAGRVRGVGVRTESSEPEAEDADDSDETDDAEEESAEEGGTPASRSARGGRNRGGSLRSRGRGRRGRGRGG